NRERLAVAIGDRAARGGDFRDALETRVTLAREELVILELQFHGTPGEAERAAHQQPQHEIRPPAEAARRVGAAAARLAACARVATFAGHDFHGQAFTVTPARCPWAVASPS